MGQVGGDQQQHIVELQAQLKQMSQSRENDLKQYLQKDLNRNERFNVLCAKLQEVGEGPNNFMSQEKITEIIYDGNGQELIGQEGIRFTVALT